MNMYFLVNYPLKPRIQNNRVRWGVDVMSLSTPVKFFHITLGLKYLSKDFVRRGFVILKYSKRSPVVAKSGDNHLICHCVFCCSKNHGGRTEINVRITVQMTLGQRSNVWMYGSRVGLKKSRSAHLKIFGLISLVDVTVYVICSDMSVTPSEITICSWLRGSKHPIHVRTHSRRSDSSPLEGRKLTTDWESDMCFKLSFERFVPDPFFFCMDVKCISWVVSSTETDPTWLCSLLTCIFLPFKKSLQLTLHATSVNQRKMGSVSQQGLHSIRRGAWNREVYKNRI